MVIELQRTVKKMERAITNLWTELEILKGPKTSLMVKTMSMDTTDKLKIPPDPPEKDAENQVLPITTEKDDIPPDPDTNFTNQPATYPGNTSAPTEDYVQELIAQGFKYAQGPAAFNFIMEEEEDQSIPLMEEQNFSLV